MLPISSTSCRSARGLYIGRTSGGNNGILSRNPWNNFPNSFIGRHQLAASQSRRCDCLLGNFGHAALSFQGNFLLQAQLNIS
jgi:hypothetical protein